MGLHLNSVVHVALSMKCSGFWWPPAWPRLMAAVAASMGSLSKQHLATDFWTWPRSSLATSGLPRTHESLIYFGVVKHNTDKYSLAASLRRLAVFFWTSHGHGRAFWQNFHIARRNQWRICPRMAWKKLPDFTRKTRVGSLGRIYDLSRPWQASRI